MANLGSNFYTKLVQIASELSMKPEDILAIMVSESGINPSSYEKQSKGSGLIGFMPSTLKNLGYQGSWKDFIHVSGEEQLDYVKKYIQSQMKFNGGPFKSAAQYYVANFWPVALRLPGIRAENPDTAFVEEHPRTVRDKSGKRYSKKYYDIGIKIDPRMERLAYVKNPLFHGSVQGVITYGDMIRQVNKNTASAAYRQAINNMHNTVGYVARIAPPTSSHSTSKLINFFNKLQDIVNNLVTGNNLVTAADATNNYLITVGSSADYYTTMEYARILSTAIYEYLDGKNFICANANNIEIECKIVGNKQTIFAALKELSAGISDSFKHATIKLGNISTFSLVVTDLKSNYKPLHPQKADLYHRVFHLKFARNK